MSIVRTKENSDGDGNCMTKKQNKGEVYERFFLNEPCSSRTKMLYHALCMIV